ncbi:hypothetical protein BGW38_003548 [Lunasporangiospora selenospora]|uniref:Uncharacterized protein n=1 Tax=Lunasporangiospora selenospora TaxID=979761 RepID=A0A9P6G0V2_9FUNG|nr:hypothetical protein BGW38_003548 [Lunasporangiospora selenospora]
MRDQELDPKRTLRMFSASQPQLSRSNTLSSIVQDQEDSDEEVEDEENNEDNPMESGSSSQPSYGATVSLSTSIHDPETPFSKKPRLQELVARSLNNSNSKHGAPELQAPEGTIGQKKAGSEFKTSTSIPLDWTIKSSLSIVSPDSLSWCDQTTGIEQVQAMQHFVQAATTASLSLERGSQKDGKGAMMRSLQSRLLAATFHWAYPGHAATIPQAQSVSRLLKNSGNLSAHEKNSIVELFSRTAEWKESFRSLYDALLNGACPYFYYVGQTWAVLFQHGSVSASGDIEAIITNSTPGLRKTLEDEDVRFVRALNIGLRSVVDTFSSKRDLEGFDDPEAEPNSIEEVGPTKTVTRSTPLADTRNLSDTLVFVGRTEVFGLFNFLLNLKTTYEDGFLYQSPMLLSQTPFLHAALKHAQLSKCRSVSRRVDGVDAMQKEYRIDIQGFLLPPLVRDLSDVLVDQQSTGFGVHSASDPRSHGLNLRPLAMNQQNRESDKGSKEFDPLVSAKSLDQFKYDKSSSLFSWAA